MMAQVKNALRWYLLLLVPNIPSDFYFLPKLIPQQSLVLIKPSPPQARWAIFPSSPAILPFLSFSHLLNLPFLLSFYNNATENPYSFQLTQTKAPPTICAPSPFQCRLCQPPHLDSVNPTLVQLGTTEYLLPNSVYSAPLFANSISPPPFRLPLSCSSLNFSQFYSQLRVSSPFFSEPSFIFLCFIFPSICIFQSFIVSLRAVPHILSSAPASFEISHCSYTISAPSCQ